ncbi:MAG TPA: hypothetical protein VFQ63_01010 [Patescibacteria group bacterium]|nr:hypothetical protein [Patescibacteria group bacterium]
MVKNIAIAVLVILLLGESVYLLEKKMTFSVGDERIENHTVYPSLPPAGSNMKGRTQVIIGKGTNLKKTPLAQFAYQVAPTMTDAAKKVITGFSITSQSQSNGSTVVTFTPKDSDDQDQQYTIKSGQTLYFIEQTPVDDKVDQDKDLNYRDDYGIITDANGIVQ